MKCLAPFRWLVKAEFVYVLRPVDSNYVVGPMETSFFLEHSMAVFPGNNPVPTPSIFKNSDISEKMLCDNGNNLSTAFSVCSQGNQ